jgi:hypothetical protein
MTRSTHQSKKRVAGGQDKKTAQGKTPAKLLVAMTGKASAAKTAEGDEPDTQAPRFGAVAQVERRKTF